MDNETITVNFWDMDKEESIYVLEMTVFPRIGETVYFQDKPFIVRDVYWHFDIEAIRTLQQVVISVEAVTI